MKQLLSKVQQISELLFCLQRAGSVKYLYFTIKFGCTEVKVEELDELIENMGSDYKLWKRQLGEHRKQYQYLNYFTSEQLLYLRYQLTQSCLHPKLIALLQSVTPLPTIEHVQRALKHARQTTKQESDTRSIEHETNVVTTGLKLQTFDELSVEKQRIVDKLTAEDFPKVLILKAMNATESEDSDTIRDWCLDNEHDHLEEDDDDFLPVQENEELIEVSESHPHVLQLVDEDYALQIALKAVRESGDDLGRAREIAQSLESGAVESTTNAPDEEW